MTVEWTTSRFDELSINFDGKRRPVKKSDRRLGPYPYYGASGVVDHVDDYIFDGDFLLVAEDGENLRTRQTPIAFLAKGRFWVNNHAHIVTGNKRADTRFLMYALQHLEIDAYLTGAVMPKLTQGNLNRIEISHPLLPEQRAIAGVLGALDDKIEQNRRTTRALERLAHAIFRAWFVDFEPVKAKAAGSNCFPSMPQHVFDALPTRFVGSEIGPIPKGWEVKTISESIVLTMGQSPPSEFYNKIGEGLPFHQGVTDYGFRFPIHRVYCTTEGRIAEPGDVLLSLRAPVGRINVADRRLILGRGLAGLRHRSDRQSFLYQQICHIFPEEDAIGDGTIYKAVSKRFLEQMPLIVPCKQAQEAFESLARPLDGLIAMCEIESRKLAETRDLLMPQLLNGQIRVEVGGG